MPGLRLVPPTPDERILALAAEGLEAWLRQTSVQRLQEMIAGGQDSPDLAPADLPDLLKRKIGWGQRGILRARLLVPRPDLYRALLDRLGARPDLADRVRLIRTLDGAQAWYLSAMERLRRQVLAALRGGAGPR